MSGQAQKLPGVKRRAPTSGAFKPGHDPRRGTSGGRPRQLVEIERVLDEHRTPEKVRDALDKLRDLALNGTTRAVYWQGAVCGYRTEYSPAYMAMLLDRVMGPVRDPIDPEELAELSDGALQELRTKLRLVK